MTTADSHPAVLCLIGGNEGYGVQRAWRGILRGLEERRWSANVYSLGGGAFRDRISVEMSVFGPDAPIPPIRGTGLTKLAASIRRAKHLAGQIQPLVRHARANACRVVLVRSPNEVWLAGVVATLAGCRAFWLMPNSVSNSYPFGVNRHLYGLMFKFLAVSPIANSRYTASTLPRTDVPVVQLGVEPERFVTSATSVSRAELGIARNGIVIGVFARLVSEKGQSRLLEALASLGSIGERIHVLLFGGPLDTEYAEQLKRTAIQFNGRVRLCGPVPDPELYYPVCDIIANTRLDPEPFGLSIVEAMLASKPVLAHRSGGPGETVLDGVTGWHIEDPSVAAFQKALRRMLRDEPRWRRMGAAGRALALEQYTHTAMVDRLIGVISAAQ